MSGISRSPPTRRISTPLHSNADRSDRWPTTTRLAPETDTASGHARPVRLVRHADTATDDATARDMMTACWVSVSTRPTPNAERILAYALRHAGQTAHAKSGSTLAHNPPATESPVAGERWCSQSHAG
jgi:hypothetical protein